MPCNNRTRTEGVPNTNLNPRHTAGVQSYTEGNTMYRTGNPEPITISDAARRLGLPRSTVVAWERRGWRYNGQHRTLSPVDHAGPKQAARYWLTDIQQAELEIGLNAEHSHRRSQRWQQIQQQRLTHFAPA